MLALSSPSPSSSSYRFLLSWGLPTISRYSKSALRFLQQSLELSSQWLCQPLSISAFLIGAQRITMELYLKNTECYLLCECPIRSHIIVSGTSQSCDIFQALLALYGCLTTPFGFYIRDADSEITQDRRAPSDNFPVLDRLDCKAFDSLFKV
jgi:hypothetical protein